MKIIKVSTELEMSVHEFPEGTMREQNKVLYGLIGNGCDLVEHVMPKRLYTELKMPSSPVKEPGKCVSMLIDEEGRLKPNKANLIGSYLYEFDKHGCCKRCIWACMSIRGLRMIRLPMLWESPLCKENIPIKSPSLK